MKKTLFVFTLSLLITLFIGCFANSPSHHVFQSDTWYYVNRGYPAYAGVALKDSMLPFPLVKAPFISIPEENGTLFMKVIDLSIFLPFLIILNEAINYLVSKIVKSHIKNKSWNLFFTLGPIFFLFLALFVYFGWFSRI
jgi:hypothetical protein